MNPDAVKDRLFLALDISDECRLSVKRLVDELKPAGKNVKWVPEENMHVTLKFLGETSVDADELLTALKTVGQKSFQAALKGLDCFPNLRHPKTIFVSIRDGSAEITALAEKINSALERHGFAKDNKFHPHLTIGRLKNREKIDPKLTEKINGQGGAIFGKFSVERFYLVKSELRPSGPVYTKIGVLQLF